MDFSKALISLKEGDKLTRISWDNKFIWLKPKATIKADWCKDSMLLELCHKNGGEIEATATISIYNKGVITTGWTPSQEDMFAEDWIIFTEDWSITK